MFELRSRGLFHVCLTVQALLLLLLFWVLHIGLAIGREAFLTAPLQYSGASLVMLVAFLLGGMRTSGYQPIYFTGLREDYRKIALQQASHSALGLMTAIIFLRDAQISRTFLALFFVGAFLINLWSVRRLPVLLGTILFRDRHSHNILLVGSASRIARFTTWVKQSEVIGMWVGGVIECTPDGNGELALEEKRLADSLLRELNSKRYSMVILLGILSPQSLLSHFISIAAENGTRLLVLNDLATVFRHSIVCFRHNGLDFIGFRQEPLQNPVNRLTKRSLDIVVSLPVVLFILPPLTLIVRIFQASQSPGSTVYRQPRRGADGESFHLLKFRTMHEHNSPQTRQAQKNDDRVYPFGRFLRRTSLDEMPQFLNVLRGEMSVVGPRPHLEDHELEFAKLQQNYRVRSHVKPGITGLAQVRGFRGEVTKDDDIILRAQSDIEYIENWSFELDLILIAQTAWHVVRPPHSAV